MVADITSDGAKLLEIEKSGTARVYTGSGGTFTLAQTLTLSASSTDIQAGAITDDADWIAVGTFDTNKVDVFKWSGSTYDINQTISVGSSVRNIALTPDHSFMVVATSTTDVIIYKHSGTQFNTLQTINGFSASGDKLAFITSDHLQLFITDKTDQKLYRYSFNEGSQQFQALQSNAVTAYSSFLFYPSLSQSEQFFSVTEDNKAYIYTNNRWFW